MAIPYGRITPVKKAGTSLARSAHHSGSKVTHGAGGRHAYLSAGMHISDTGLATDYRNKFGVEHSELVLPGGGTCDREKFWNAVDTHKTQRETADVAYDLILAFPHEFSAAERKKDGRAIGEWIAERYKVGVDYGLHKPEIHKGSSEKNYHGHYLISARKVSEDGTLGFVQRELNHQVCQRVDLSRGRTQRVATAGEEIRMAWQRIVNERLIKKGHDPIDMRSYEKQGIKKEGGKHLGAAETRRRREEKALANTPTATQKLQEFIARPLAPANHKLLSEHETRRELQRKISTARVRSTDLRRERLDIREKYVERDDPKPIMAVGSSAAYDHDAFGTFFRDVERQNSIAKRRAKVRIGKYSEEDRKKVKAIEAELFRAERRVAAGEKLLAENKFKGVRMSRSSELADGPWLQMLRREVARVANEQKKVLWQRNAPKIEEPARSMGRKR